MKRIAAFLLLAAGILAPAANAQAPAPAAPACPSTKTIDELVTALYAAVSGTYDQDRTCFRALFLPDARLSPISKATDGSFAPRNLTVEDWITAVSKRGKGNFFEKGIATKMETYGSLAHFWSTYESRHEPGDATPFARGINSIQAVYNGTEWKIQAILWQAETPDTPLPSKYLP